MKTNSYLPKHFNTINNVTHSSIIDHFIVNDRLYNALTEATVINSVENHSSHNPIYLKFNMNMLNLEVEEQFSVPKPGIKPPQRNDQPTRIPWMIS